MNYYNFVMKQSSAWSQHTELLKTLHKMLYKFFLLIQCLVELISNLLAIIESLKELV